MLFIKQESQSKRQAKHLQVNQATEKKTSEVETRHQMSRKKSVL